MTIAKQVLVSLLICLMLIMGCSETERETEPISKKMPLLIGLIPERNIFKQLDRYEPLADYISKKIGVNIELKVLTRYGNIIDNFMSADMDGAFFGSFTYTLAHAKIKVEAIARPENIQSISTYHGLIFVRKDSGINSLKDMQGKSFAFVDKATTAGYLLPLAYFKKLGIRDYQTFFKETYFTGTHEDAIYDVLNKKVVIGAAKNTVFNRLAAEDSRIKNELVILERSPDVPENALAVRGDLDDSIKSKLKETLLDMHNDPVGREVLKNFGAQRFIETTDIDYANVYSYAKEIGLNLATYDYWN
jgi:phosphonate transport system substrate-binding protein